jgi:hypothetical protein
MVLLEFSVSGTYPRDHKGFLNGFKKSKEISSAEI